APAIRKRNRNRGSAVSAFATVVSAGATQRRLFPVTTSPARPGRQIRVSATERTSCHPLYSSSLAPETSTTPPAVTPELPAVPVRAIVVSTRAAPLDERRLVRIVIEPTCTVAVSPPRVIRRDASETDVSVRWDVGRVWGARLVGSERATITAVSTDPETPDPPIPGVPALARVPGGIITCTIAGSVLPGARSSTRNARVHKKT